MAIQPDGKIVVGGSTSIPNSSLVNQNDLAVVRFNLDGSLDNGFGNGNGRYVIGGATVERVRKIVLQPDGKILLTGDRLNRVGTFYPGVNIFAIRLLSNGTLDANFGTGGTAAAPSFGDRSVCTFCGEESRSLALLPNGKIIVIGKVYAFNNGAFQYGLGIVRFLSDGQLDASFGTGGIVFSIFSSGQTSAPINYDFNSLTLQTDGKLVVGGSGNANNAPTDFAVFRYTPTGELDTTFDGDGIVILSVESSNDSVNEVLVQPNGKIVAAGSSAVNVNGFIISNFALARFNADGSLDTTFGNNGKVITDFNGNGDDDKISHAVLQNNGKILAVGFTKPNLGSGSTPRLALARYIGETVISNRTRFDFDGDGKADISVFRPDNGVWYLDQSANGFTGVQFGVSADKIVPADYDGDGKTDVDVYRSGVWYLNRSSAGFTGFAFGAADDIPQPADFDGDGKAELAVWRPSNGVWYVYNLANNQFTAAQFGANGDKPVVGNYNGDGKADYAVFRPSNGVWYLLQSTAGFTGVQFGISTDLPTPADYDSDGKADIAVFRSGTWYLQRSTNGFLGIQFGASTDKPVPNAFVH